MQKRRRTQSLALIFVMAAAVLTYLVLIFVPIQQSIGEVRRQLHAKRQYILRIDGRFAEFEARRQQLASAEEFVSSVKSSAGSSGDLAEFLSAITEMAQGSGITVQRISPGGASDGATIREHRVELGVEGEFQHLFAFLSEIEVWPGNVWLTDVAIERSSETGGILECRLILAVFTDLPDSSG